MSFSQESPMIERLFSFKGKGSTTFEEMKRLDERLGKPHRSYPTIHVGGTNGKGSVALKIAASLYKEGYKVGLYTSPHLEDFRERIQVNFKKIPLKKALPLLEKIYSAIEGEHSFFDLLTALAFLYFQEEKVDYAVIEVGLGGRKDATNVIVPILSIITSIGWDHQEILGDTLEKIAWEKGGIEKPNVPLIVGPTARKFYPKAILTDPVDHPFYDYENQAVAKKALDLLNIAAHGLDLRPPCRFEKVGRAILDVAHNPDGFLKLVAGLQFFFPGEKFDFLVAFSQSKDKLACLKIIAPFARSIIYLEGLSPRLEKGEVVREEFPSLAIMPLDEALKSAKGLVVFTGSFYIMKEAREALLKLDFAHFLPCLPRLFAP